MVEITDRETAQAWLESQDRQACVWFATRCALRALPALGKEENSTSIGLAFEFFRAALISAAAATCPAAEMTGLETAARAAKIHSAAAARSAADSALSAADSAFSAAYSTAAAAASLSADSATLSADSATAARSAVWGAATLDANAPKTWKKLWHDAAPPDGLVQAWDALKAQWDADGPHWSFWIDWYEAVRDGRWTNWDLIFEIATKVSEEDWDKGAAHVAGEIASIEAEFLAERTRLHETVEINPESGLFRAVPADIQNSDFIAALLERVEDYLDDALSGNNGLTATSREVKTLKRTIEKYANDPQRMELDFTSVSVSLRRQIHETGELATSEDNLALLEATEESARGLRTNHPEIAENRNRLAQQALSEMKPEELELLEEARPLLVAISEGQMAEDFERDIPTLINDATMPLPSGAPPLPGADEATRIFHRTSNMASVYKKTVDNGAALFDSPEIKTIRLVGVYGGVGGALYALVKLGLSVFGVL